MNRKHAPGPPTAPYGASQTHKRAPILPIPRRTVKRIVLFFSITSIPPPSQPPPRQSGAADRYGHYVRVIREQPNAPDTPPAPFPSSRTRDSSPKRTFSSGQIKMPAQKLATSNALRSGFVGSTADGSSTSNSFLNCLKRSASCTAYSAAVPQEQDRTGGNDGSRNKEPPGGSSFVSGPVGAVDRRQRPEGTWWCGQWRGGF